MDETRRVSVVELSQLEIITDDSFIQSDTDFLKQVNRKLDFKPEENYFNDISYKNNLVFSLVVVLANKKCSYYRYPWDFFKLLSYIGGSSQIISIIFFFIARYFTNIIFNIQMINHLFIFNSKSRIQKSKLYSKKTKNPKSSFLLFFDQMAKQFKSIKFFALK